MQDSLPEVSDLVRSFRLDDVDTGFLNLPNLDPEEEVESSESEDESDFHPGGYHPATVGETFNQGRYVILHKLGWGHFSTVWLAFDTKEKRHCAIKIQKSNPHYAEAARDEIRLLKALKTDNSSFRDTVVELLDHFEHSGPNGSHVCLTFEVLSKSLLCLLKRFHYKGIPKSMIQPIARQVLEALCYIHDTCRIIHTDLKPENILFVPSREEVRNLQTQASLAVSRLEQLKIPETRDDFNEVVQSFYMPNPELAFASGKVKLVDFGNACWTTKHFTEDIQTRQYRAPEVLLGCGYDTKADIWSFACIVFELATGDFLFDPHSGDDYDRDEDHLALMIELLGPVPRHMRQNGVLTRNYLDENGEPLHISQLNFWSLRDVFREKYKFPASDADLLSSFLLPMLRYDPKDRASAREQLQHPFMREPRESRVVNSGQLATTEESFDITVKESVGFTAPGESLRPLDHRGKQALTETYTQEVSHVRKVTFNM